MAFASVIGILWFPKKETLEFRNLFNVGRSQESASAPNITRQEVRLGMRHRQARSMLSGTWLGTNPLLAAVMTAAATLFLGGGQHAYHLLPHAKEFSRCHHPEFQLGDGSYNSQLTDENIEVQRS